MEKFREFNFKGADFDARLTLMQSAQAFHWQEADGDFYAVCAGAALRVRQVGAGIRVTAPESVPEEALLKYFDLNRDYGQIAARYAAFDQAREAFSRLPGLRVLRQSAWEALVAFVLSQNNNTTRIQKLVRALCAAHGRRIEAFGQTLYAFPSPQALVDAGSGALRALGCGYRAEYLAAAARRVAEGFPLDALASMEYEDARRLLRTLDGVGPKVADCVLLFGCGHLCAYPVDVWVARLTRAWFGIKARSPEALAQSARALFGQYAGILQQYLFHCARSGLIDANTTPCAGKGAPPAAPAL
jgi:N-glycosylase/DNA lyase